MEKKHQETFYKPYWFFASVRFLLVFVPQSGYIHPDEYFQTLEPIAGRIFEFEASLPWEFNVTAPVRSIGVPYFTIGLSYKILQVLNFFMRAYFDVSYITPYFLLVTPRLFLCLLSFCIDFCVYKISVNNNEKYKSRLLVLSTSFVLVVFASRTFSNTIEMVLFALLLYFVAESMIFSNIVVRQNEYFSKRYSESKSPAERAIFHKMRLFLAPYSYRNCFFVSTITVLGFFNRPTFLCYSVFPIFFWLYRGIGYKTVTTMQFHVRILMLILSSMPSILLLITVDSFFYGYISWGEIMMLDVSINNFVFPPLNFIKYNIQNENLSKHGLHPRYLHVLINIPLLFNVLGLFALYGIADMVNKLLKKKFHLLPTVRSVKGLMTTSFITPLCALSVFPHQEPRFLLPVVVPLVYLFSDKVYKDSDRSLVKITKSQKITKEFLELQEPKKEKKYLFKLWLFINAICCFYFGFLQQGGVFSATQYVSKEINTKTHFNYHIITSHMYSIPHVFFMQPDADKLFFKNNYKYKLNKRVFTYEMGSRDLDRLMKDVLTILHVATISKKRFKVYLMISGSLRDKLRDALSNPEILGLQMKRKATFYPHFSGEAIPDFGKLFDVLVTFSFKPDNFSDLLDCLSETISFFNLELYEISYIKQSNA